MKNKDFDPEKDFVDVDLNVYKRNIFTRFYKWLRPKKFNKVGVALEIFSHYREMQGEDIDKLDKSLLDLGTRMTVKHPNEGESKAIIRVFKTKFPDFGNPPSLFG